MMYETIKIFNQQFGYKAKIVNSRNLKKHSKFVVLGMGGSHLAADLLLNWNPGLDITVHSDYGLPHTSKDSLIITSSYSGNTEEVIDGLQQAVKKGLSVAVVATGGKLIEIAQKKKLPYVQMPDTGIQPRSALGFSILALMKIIGDEKGLKELKKLRRQLKFLRQEKAGKKLAQKLKGCIPIIYSSARNKGVAYNWKIKFNETGKIPAFYNVLPELNHNEITGFSAQSGPAAGGDVSDTGNLSKNFKFIFLQDSEDDKRIIKRMRILRSLYNKRGLGVEAIKISGKTKFHKIFSSLVLADWTAYYTAELYGVDPEQVPMQEEFKKLIA